MATFVRTPADRRRYPPTHTGSVRDSATLPPFAEWFPALVRDELRPYPGRALLMLRYTIAATLVMLAIVVFRIPGAAVGGFFCIVLPRDSPQSTLRSGGVLLLTIALSLLFVLAGTVLFVNYPLTHFLWVAGSFFLGFYALAVVSNYAAASAFAVLIVVAVPQWDTQIPTAALLTENLWTAGSIGLAVVVTVFVETVFALFQKKDPLAAGISQRLCALSLFFADPHGVNLEKVQQLAAVGVSRLRQLALSVPGKRGDDAAHRTTAVALVGRLMDLAASMESLPEAAGLRLQGLSEQMKELDTLLGRPAAPLPAPSQAHEAEELPVIAELEHNAGSLRLVLTHQNSKELAVDSISPKKPGVFKDDAWTNPEYLRFAIRGSLAAFACYVVMRGIFWPELSTALFTCVVTALTSSGASRQKQLLRTTGAMTGSLLIGLVGQIVILPMLDTISGFLVYFMVVLFFASWFITASPRVNYFGVQIALGFFIVNLTTPYPEFSLAASRNNIAGICLGLLAMWLIFDQLWYRPAAEVMIETFRRNLKLMARLTGPWKRGKAKDLVTIRTLREKIEENFTEINHLSDAILFEFGRDRRRALRVRAVLRSSQPTLRTLFLLHIASLQLRVGPAARPLVDGTSEEQMRFEGELRETLERLARLLESRKEGEPASPPDLHRLKQSVAALTGDNPRDQGEKAASKPLAMLTAHLLRNVEQLQQQLSATPVLRQE